MSNMRFYFDNTDGDLSFDQMLMALHVISERFVTTRVKFAKYSNGEALMKVLIDDVRDPVPTSDRDRVAELEQVLGQCLVAFDLTRQYVGYEVLPMIDGWSHYDAVVAIHRVLGYPPPVATVPMTESEWVANRREPNPAINEQFAAVDMAPEPVVTAGDGATVVRTPFIQTTPEPEPVTDDPTKHVCTDCQRSFSTRTGLRTHRSMMHSPKESGHVCADCGRTYAKPSSLRTHRIRQHTEVPMAVVAMVLCAYCDKKFYDEFGRDIHVLSMHEAEHAGAEAIDEEVARLAAIEGHPSTEPVALEVVPDALVKAVAEWDPAIVVGDKVVACTECNFVTHAATSELMQQHTFKVHKRIRNLTEKRPFVLGADDGGDAA